MKLYIKERVSLRKRKKHKSVLARLARPQLGCLHDFVRDIHHSPVVLLTIPF